MQSALSEAVIAGAEAAELEALPVPDHFAAAVVREEDIGIFRSVEDKDVRKSVFVEDVPMPDLAPDEALIAVMASSINYNTVWTAMFEPVPTFQFLRQMGRNGGWEARHDLPYHILGSDASGVVVRTGSSVRRWKAGDHVVISPAYVDEQDHDTHQDGMLGENQKAWGFETNFGGLAHYAVVRASQLMPKPAALTWEEAAVNPLCASTAYRMLVSERGARMKQGDVVLVWGATGGLGAYAVQLVLNGGGIPVGVVNSEEKARILMSLGCEASSIAMTSKREIRPFSSGPTAGREWGKPFARLWERIRTSCSSMSARRLSPPPCSSLGGAAPSSPAGRAPGTTTSTTTGTCGCASSGSSAAMAPTCTSSGRSTG